MNSSFIQYDRMPDKMLNYLSNYGWHFSKRMAEWAISMMKDRNGNPVEHKTKEQIESLLKSNGIDTSKMFGYDAVYVEAMCRSDFYGSSITDEKHVLMYIEDLLGDKDGYDGIAFSRFYIDTLQKGIPIIWDDLL